jgi:hypothetical protein
MALYSCTVQPTSGSTSPPTASLKDLRKKAPRMVVKMRCTLSSLISLKDRKWKWRSRRLVTGLRPPPGGPMAATNCVSMMMRKGQGGLRSYLQGEGGRGGGRARSEGPAHATQRPPLLSGKTGATQANTRLPRSPDPPAPVVHPLAQQLNGRLREVLFALGHVEVVHEHHVALARGRPEHALAPLVHLGVQDVLRRRAAQAAQDKAQRSEPTELVSLHVSRTCASAS